LFRIGLNDIAFGFVRKGVQVFFPEHRPSRMVQLCSIINSKQIQHVESLNDCRRWIGRDSSFPEDVPDPATFPPFQYLRSTIHVKPLISSLKLRPRFCSPIRVRSSRLILAINHSLSVHRRRRGLLEMGCSVYRTRTFFRCRGYACVVGVY